MTDAYTTQPMQLASSAGKGSGLRSCSSGTQRNERRWPNRTLPNGSGIGQGKPAPQANSKLALPLRLTPSTRSLRARSTALAGDRKSSRPAMAKAVQGGGGRRGGRWPLQASAQAHGPCPHCTHLQHRQATPQASATTAFPFWPCCRCSCAAACAEEVCSGSQ